MTDLRLSYLRAALDRSRERVARCRAELERFDHFDTGDSHLGPARDRLAEDLRKAELDASWAEIALADATQPAEVPVS